MVKLRGKKSQINPRRQKSIEHRRGVVVTVPKHVS